MANKKLISDEEFNKQFAAASKRGEKNARHDPRAVSISNIGEGLTVTLATGWSFNFDPRRLSEFANATDADIQNVRIMGDGSTLGWDSLDVHIGVGAILSELLGREYLISLSQGLIGSRTSRKKAAASRSNGALGGRPRKQKAGEKQS